MEAGRPGRIVVISSVSARTHNARKSIAAFEHLRPVPV